MKSISSEEWEKIKQNSDSRTTKFHDLFNITCKKCGSKNVEIFGDYNDSDVYYAGETGNIELITKCHDCGNAKCWVEIPSCLGRDKLE